MAETTGITETCMEVEFKPGVHIPMGQTWWRTIEIDRNENTALLVAESNVTYRVYHDIVESITWEKCTMRSWLNGEYFNTFTAEEKDAIMETILANPSNPEYGTPGGNPTTDRIFLLSIDEAKKYFKDNQDRIPGKWWLRSPGRGSGNAAYVESDGCIKGSGNYFFYRFGVRPALKINLKSGFFQSLIVSESPDSVVLKVSELKIREGCAIKASPNVTTVEIPMGVTEIREDAFSNCKGLTGVIIPEGVISIGNRAFSGCSSLTNVTIPDSLTSIGALTFCCCSSLKRIILPKGVTVIGFGAFFYCTYLEQIIIMTKDNVINAGQFARCPETLAVIAHSIHLVSLKENGLVKYAVRGFIARSSDYSDQSIINEYINYISSQRKKILPVVYEYDNEEILRLLAERKKITKKNIEQDYLLPAMQCKAEKCVAFLNTLFPTTGVEGKQACNVKTDVADKLKGRELWDGIHFSIDGKKLLKYPEEPGRTIYEVPKGTKEICKGAFDCTGLQAVLLPQSVTTIRKEAFKVDRKTIFIHMPTEMKSVPGGAFWGSYYYISSPVIEFASQFNDRTVDHIIYTGGPLDDLPPKTKKNAVLGFLFAVRTGLEDMTKWKESYYAHIKKSWKTYVKLAEEDEAFLQMMLDESLLTQKGVETLLDFAETNNRTELKAALLSYQQSHYSIKRKKDDLFLSEDDQELQRLLQMTERREQIKDQKGIKGLVFVSTGYFKHFGEVYGNEFAFYGKDMSDLKAYIEVRGGIYRSTVSSKTDYLICNDPDSDSAKSKKAAELGVPVITEEQFLKMANEKE